MLRLTVDPELPDRAVLGRAVDVLRAGHLVAFPTETVYGLGARALNGPSIRRIYEAKGRPSWNPLIVHVTSAAMARDGVVAAWPDVAERLAKAFWPGPLTLVLPRAPGVPDEVTAGLDTVAVRAPAHPVALLLVELLGEPIAAPSANRFTEISPTTAAHVEKSLGDAVDVIIDGGACTVGVESTVLDLTVDPPAILRSGGVSLETLRTVVPSVVMAVRSVEAGEARASPGQASRHYAPKARTVLIAHGERAAWDDALRDLPQPVGSLSFTLPASPYRHQALPLDPAAAQARLYAALHALEDAGCSSICLEAPPRGAVWDAVRDRLARAAS